MNEQQQERFNLSDFVLGYLEEAGSVVMPPEFGVYEVLLPDELAKTLAFDDYARIAFAAPASIQENGASTNGTSTQVEDAVRLGVSHPLVETIAQSLTDQPVNIRTYIRGVRIDKRGLAELARKQIGLPNARIAELPKSNEEATQHHYLLCNFKIAFLSEEKQEELISVVMDVQAGHAVTNDELQQRLALLDTEPAYGGLTIAAPRWLGAGNALAGDALAPETLAQLLPRAEAALHVRLAEQATTLAARMERHLALDLARIGDYYDEMAADLQKRQGRLAADDERRQEFDDKLAMLTAERSTKLDDARGRYKLRVEMKLVNVLLATQAKVTLPMLISNRTAKITRTVVWDPLLHQLEPLVCDVCGKAGEGLHLCTGGHLAHEACLAPQCVDCKREFCQLCTGEVDSCVVCQRPVCRSSLIKCATCTRGTCSEHQQLCHAADGEPATLPESITPAIETDVQAEPSEPESKSSTEQANSRQTNLQKNRASTKSSPSKKPKSSKTKTEPRKPMVKGVRIVVEVNEDKPLVVAFVMKSTKRVLATRSFELMSKGLWIECQCEKSPCPTDGYYHYPRHAAGITAQIEGFISALQKEYLIPNKKVKYFRSQYGQPQESQRLVLSGAWLDPEYIRDAVRGFEKLRDE